MQLPLRKQMTARQWSGVKPKSSSADPRQAPETGDENPLSPSPCVPGTEWRLPSSSALQKVSIYERDIKTQLPALQHMQSVIWVYTLPSSTNSPAALVSWSKAQSWNDNPKTSTPGHIFRENHNSLKQKWWAFCCLNLELFMHVRPVLYNWATSQPWKQLKIKSH